MALDYAINTELRVIPVDTDGTGAPAPSVARALSIYHQAQVAASSTDIDATLPVDTSRVHGATLVRLAEAAIDYGELDRAKHALLTYRAEDPVKDQYYVRALFVEAALRNEEASKLNGALKLGLVRESIALILQGLTIALEGGLTGDGKIYSFLAYNASVHHWTAVRPLLRVGAKQHAIPSLTRVLDALTKLNDPDIRWRARHCLALAACHAESNELPKALAYSTQAQDFLAQLETPVEGSFDAETVEEALRLRLHVAALQEPQAAADGSLDAKLAPAAKQQPQQPAAKGAPDTRSKVLLSLQPILSASSPGAIFSPSSSMGYSNAVGVGALALQPGGPVGNKRATAANVEALRGKLLDLLRQLRPAAVSEYEWMQAESQRGSLNPDMPDFRAEQKKKEISVTSASVDKSAPAKGSVHAQASIIAKRAENLDLVALVAQAAIQNGCMDVAYACVRALNADKSTSPAGAVVTDAIDAQLLVSQLAVDDAHYALGHFVEIPSELLSSLASLEKVQAEAQAAGTGRRASVVGAAARAEESPSRPGSSSNVKGGRRSSVAQESKAEGKTDLPVQAIPTAAAAAAVGPQRHIRTRRQSLALQASKSFLPTRSITGRPYMLPNHVPSKAEYPQLHVEHVQAIEQHRRILACKLLKRALSVSKSNNNRFLMELCATLAWNISLPLLKHSTRRAVQPTLAAAADALHTIDSALVPLRVRLHLECARTERELGMLAEAAQSAARALALDYGGMRLDPAYAHSAPDRAALLPMPALPDGRTGLEPAPGGDVRELSTQRPLDRFILAEGRQAILSTALYNEPESPLDAAFVLIEQARTAKDHSAAASLLQKACKCLDVAQGSDATAASAYLKHRRPSFHDISADTARTVSVESTHTPKEGMLPTGEAGGALAVQAHKLWFAIAEVGSKASAWDAVIRACHVVRGVVWSPLLSRDMVLLQIKADLLLADAAAALAAGYGQVSSTVAPAETGWLESVQDAVEMALQEQKRREKIALLVLEKKGKVTGTKAEQLPAGEPYSVRWWDVSEEDMSAELSTPAAAPAPEAAPVDPKAAKTGNAAAADKKGEAAPPAAGTGPSPPQLQPRKPDSIVEISVDGRPVTLSGYLTTHSLPGPLPTDAEMLPRGPPRQFIAQETGHAPLFKPLPADARALGVIVPGCPLALLALKSRAITALSRAARRAVALKAPWAVETAAMKLWNAHLHVWQSNEYGHSVMPVLLSAVCDVLRCLAAVGSSNGGLLAKLAHVLARYYEEAGRIAALDEALGIPAGCHAYFSCAGASLASIVPRQSSHGATDSSSDNDLSQEDKGHDGLHEAEYASLLPSLVLEQKLSPVLFDVASGVASTVLSLPPTLIRPMHRRPLLLLKARCRLVASHGLAIPGLLPGPGKGGAPSGSGMESVSRGVDMEVEGGECPEFARALAYLAVSAHPAPSLQEKIAAMRAATTSIEKVSAELESIAALVSASSGAQAPLTRPPTAGPKGSAAAAKAAPTAAGKVAAAAAVPSAATGLLQFNAESWGKGDSTLPSIYGLTADGEYEYALAVGSGATQAAKLAEAGALRKELVALVSELWARAAAVAVQLAELSSDPAYAQAPTATAVTDTKLVGKGAAAPVASAEQGSSAQSAAVVGEPDVSLLVDAQRCAAACANLIPSNPLRVDELGSLFGTRGHGFEAYGMPLGPQAVKVLAPAQDTVDVRIGQHAFSHRFGSGPDSSTVDGAGRGGLTSCFKWWCLAETAWCKAIAMLINPSRQSREEQDALRRAALDHAVTAARWSSKIKDGPLLYSAALHAWNVSVSVSRSTLTRSQLLEPLQQIVTCMKEAGTSVQSHDALLLQSELYKIVLGCYADLSSWEDGLRSSQDAFSTLPAVYQARLWGPLLLFQSKLGHDCTNTLNQLQTMSPSLQARLWVSLARLAALPVDQALAYQSALSLLTGMFTKAYVLTDYAEWLHANHFPVQDVRDALLAAAAIVMSVEQASAVDDTAPDDGRDGRGSVAKSSWVGQGVAQQQSTMARTVVTGMQGTVRDTRGSMGRSVAASTRMGGTAAGRGSVVTTSTAAPRDEAAAPTDWPASLEVGHLDLLVRIFTQLAMTAETGMERVQYCLTAVFQVMRMWESTARTANTAVAEKLFQTLPAARKAELQPYMSTWMEQQVNEGPHRVPAVGDMGGWVTFWSGVCAACSDIKGAGEVGHIQAEVPTARATTAKGSKLPGTAASAVSPPVAKDTPLPAVAQRYDTLRALVYHLPVRQGVHCISKHALKAPAMTLSTLGWLTDTLMRAGHAAAVAPLLATQHMLAADSLEFEPPCVPAVDAVLVSSLQWASACNGKEATAALVKHVSVRATLAEAEKTAFEQEVLLREDALRQEGDKQASDAGRRARFREVDAAGSTRAGLAAAKVKAALEGGSLIAGIPSITRPVLSWHLVHKSWLVIARCAVDMGLTRGCKQLLSEARRHAAAHQDAQSLWQCDCLEARVAFLEGDGKAAVSLCLSAVEKASSGDGRAWGELLTLVTAVLKRYNKYSDARVVLQTALSALDSACHPSSLDLADPSTLPATNGKGKGVAGPMTAALGQPIGAAIKDAAEALIPHVSRPTHRPSPSVDLDALGASICVRVMLADVYTWQARRARQLRAPWMNDWVAADALFAEAANTCRRYGLETSSALLAHVLHSHGRAILSCPGADPSPGNCPSEDDYAAVGHDLDMTDKFRATPPARRARLLYLGLACKLLREGHDVVSAWGAAVESFHCPPGWVSPPSALAAAFREDMAKALLLCAEEEAAATIAAERSLLTGVSADPVTLYLMRADAEGSGKHMVTLSSTGPARAKLALDTVSAALASLPPDLYRQQARLLVTYGLSLVSLMQSDAFNLSFAVPTGGGEGNQTGTMELMTGKGMVELIKALWDVPGEKVSAPSLGDIDGSSSAPPVEAAPVADSKTKGKAAPTASSKAAPAKAAKPAAAAGASSSEAITNTELMPLGPLIEPLEAGGAVEAVASLISTPQMQVLHQAVPATIRSLHSRSVRALQQAVAASAAAGDWSGLGAASAGLVECFACLAPTRAALALAVYQSCEAVQDLRTAFVHAAGEANKQLVHMRVLDTLQQVWLQPEMQPVEKAARGYLGRESLAYRLLQPQYGAAIEHVLGGLPVGTRVLILQRSPSSRVLYAAVLVRLKGGKGDSSVVSSDPSFAPVPGIAGRVWRHELSDAEREELSQLAMDCRSFSMDFAPAVRRLGDSLGYSADVTRQQAGEGMGEGDTVQGGSARDEAEDRALALIEGMNRLLAPVICPSAAGSWLDSSTGPVVLCAEKPLASLPLEALTAFAQAKAVTRDFSLAFLGHRLAVSTSMRAGGKDSGKEVPTPPSAGPWYEGPGLPGCNVAVSSMAVLADPSYEDLRPGESKVDEPAAVDSAVQRATAEAPSRLTTLGLIDILTKGPLGATVGQEVEGKVTSLLEVIGNSAAGELSPAPAPAPSPPPVSPPGKSPRPSSASSAPSLGAGGPGGALGSSWSVLRGDRGIPSSAAIQGQLRTAVLTPAADDGGAYNGSAFLYAGPGPFLSHCDPAYLAGLLCPGVRLAILAAFAGTERSARRAAAVENDKRMQIGRLELEDSWETAALLSLAGVGTVVAPAWPLSASACQAQLVGTLHAAVRQGAGIGEAVRSVFGGPRTSPSSASAVSPAGEPGKAGTAELSSVKARVKYGTVVYGLPHMKMV